MRYQLHETTTLREFIAHVAAEGRKRPGPVHLTFTLGGHSFEIAVTMIAVDGVPVSPPVVAGDS